MLEGGGAVPVEEEIIQGIGNEVFYFFMFLSLTLVIVGAWFSTQVVEPVVSSVILVERTTTNNTNTDGQRRDGDNRTEYIQYRLDPTSTRTGVNLVSSTGPGQRQAHAHLQENYTADLQRITEPRRTETESRSSSQLTESNNTDEASPSSSSTIEPSDAVDSTDVKQQQEPPALEPIPDGEKVTVRLKFLNETERDAEASLRETLATFRRRNFTEEILANKSVRFIFNGQMLREESNTLRSYGMFDKCVVHCLIAQLPAATRSSEGSTTGGVGAAGGTEQQQQDHHQHQQQPLVDDQDFDVSELFIPVLGFGLIILWYFAFTYSTYFNSMSTSALLGLTSLFLFTLYGTNVHINVITRN